MLVRLKSVYIWYCTGMMNNWLIDFNWKRLRFFEIKQGFSDFDEFDK